MKVAICHPERRAQKGDLCGSCYNRAMGYPKLAIRDEKCRECGKSDLRPRRYYMLKRGLCVSCRNRESRKIVISHYSGGQNCCECCGETRYEFLAVDHVERLWVGKRPRNEGGDRLIRRLIRCKFPVGYRILCHNCNSARGFHGVCPHEKERVADKMLKETLTPSKEVIAWVD